MMMTMGMKKIPVILVVCMLLLSTLDVLAQRPNSFHITECCFEYYPKRLPRNNVVKFHRTVTGPHCAKAGVVFKMKNGAKLCVDPTKKWVQNTINHVKTTTQGKQTKKRVLG